MAKIIGDYSEEQRLAEQQAIADALREQGTKATPERATTVAKYSCAAMAGAT